MNKILITTGGTGGHVYTAEALAQQLKKGNAPVELLFVGGGLSNNPYFARDKYSYEEVAAATNRGKRGWDKFSVVKLPPGLGEQREDGGDARVRQGRSVADCKPRMLSPS